MKRAIRRHYMALIKKKIQREVEEINEYFSRPARWGNQSPERRETRRQAAIRYAYRDDGHFVRTKEASGRGYFCGCEWCISNWTFASQKEIARINDEENDFIEMGCPPDWGYDWADLWSYDDYDTYFDPEDDWWWEWLESQGISYRDYRKHYWEDYFEHGRRRMNSPRETFCLAEVV